ncbi:hypothetical protein CDQ91_05870 [Sphingopyxis witflariensis]|uniref:Enamine deaminase RidA n=1 Tax=Sphingopyxis witflariensis TaxID=173675 RepID=A0A246K3Z2_9SPHN|nr:hypothetical protein CDQ91_05870 [Sphingopyxis witflariensis]
MLTRLRRSPVADNPAALVGRQTLASASPYEPLYGYSRAVRIGDRISVAGTAPIEPDGSSTPGDAGVQAARCLTIIADALAALGGSPADVVRTRMFITDPADADLVGRAHGAMFGDIRPAATMVVVSALLRPEWKIEIEAEALIEKTA